MFLLHSRKVPFNSTFFFLNLSSQQIYAQFSEGLKAKLREMQKIVNFS